jgi:N-methylhydantoinase B
MREADATARPETARVDPVTVEVIRGALETIAEQMAIHVGRTATTPLLNQSNERNATILDERGRLAALSVGIPQFMLSSMGPVRFAVGFFGPRGFREGDVIAANDPYHGGGHLPDWSVFAPVFCDGELVLFASIQCHHADTAGQTPGGYPADAVDVWAEGFRCPAVKLVDAGVPREDVLYLFQTNNRTPTYRGDLEAQIGAAQLGARRCAELARRYGAPAIRGACAQLMAQSERRLREQIASWPDGVYEADSWYDHDVKGNKDLHVHCKVTIRGDQLVIDYTGSDARPELQAWSTKGNSLSMAMSQLCSAIDPGIPKNEGLFGPVEIILPEGTVVNPTPGRPVSMGTHHPGCEVSEALARALSQAIPEGCVPQLYKRAMPQVLFGTHPKTGQLFIDHSSETRAHVCAAAYGQDGWGALNAGFGNIVMATAEINETLLPQRLLSSDLATDTGGAGRWRGQCGSLYLKEALTRQTVYTFVGGMKYPSQGVAGGGNGSPLLLYLRSGGPRRYFVEHRALGVELEPGERVELHDGGGGGFGDPLEREPEKVRDDVLDEYVSREAAERVYGVVLRGDLWDYSLEVDAERTSARREQIRAERRASAAAAAPGADCSSSAAASPTRG